MAEPLDLAEQVAELRREIEALKGAIAPTVFVTDSEIARRWGVGEKTARAAIREFDKRPGFPKRDPLFADKRFWPAVQAFMRRRYGIGSGGSTVQDGVETWTENWDSGPVQRLASRPALDRRAEAQQVYEGSKRESQERRRGRGRGDAGIYSPDIERRIQEGIRERGERDKKDE